MPRPAKHHAGTLLDGIDNMMGVMGMWELTFWVGAMASGAILVIHMLACWAVMKTRRLAEDPLPQEQTWPTLSVILAACNEADTLEPALRTLLKTDYPQLEIIVVNDRSTDDTGEIIDQLATEDPRIHAVHLTHLADGWLGKVHALEQGRTIAKGDVLLFTDADIHFAPGALKRAVSRMQRNTLDHLSLLPHLTGGTLLTQATHTAFAGILVLGAETILRWHPGLALGVGAFNLVRAEALERAGGFHPLKMEVVDDSGLACLLQRAGGRCDWLAAPSSVSLTWYRSLGEMMRGLEKNLYGLMAGYSGLRALWVAAVMSFLSIGPWLTLLPGTKEHAWVFGLVAYLSTCVISVLLKFRFKLKMIPCLLSPVGQLCILFFFVRGAVLCWQRQGIIWRGTHYPLSKLKEGQYVTMVG